MSTVTSLFSNNQFQKAINKMVGYFDNAVEELIKTYQEKTKTNPTSFGKEKLKTF